MLNYFISISTKIIDTSKRKKYALKLKWTDYEGKRKQCDIWYACMAGSILSNGEHGQLVSYKQLGGDTAGRNLRSP